MGSRRRVAVVSGVCAAAVAVALGAYSLLGGEGGTSNVAAASDGDAAGAASAGPPTAEEVTATAAAFLRAWQAGDAAAAAALTDDPRAAEAALGGLAGHVSLSGLRLTPGTPAGGEPGRVPFSFAAHVSYDPAQAEDAEESGGSGQSAGAGESGDGAPGGGGSATEPVEWGYDSELTVVRDEASGEPVVAWSPEVLYPGLAEGQAIEAGPLAEEAPIQVLDVNGEELTAEEHPALAGVLSDIRERYAEEAGASAGAELRIVDEDGERVEQLLELEEPAAGEVPTTIDPVLQRAAEQSVAEHGTAAVVAIQPSTGAIRALANAPADGFDTALEGSYAPGSTFKIVTASLLIDRGLASADAPHPCPKTFEFGGWPFHNDDDFEIEGGTFADSFAASCNTAFISQAPELSDSDLGDQARDVFGLGLTWSVGVTSMDGQVPTQHDAQMAASLIGQGGVRMNPLNMASVSATVQHGSFLQPYLVPPDFDGRTLAQAARTLSSSTQSQLRQLMHRTAVSGTAAEAMAGVGGDFGAKTGSAEVDGQERPNAWFTAYRDDLAAAAVVPDSGHGGDNAGPIVADVLTAAP
ncbi:penicillin-binding transpeptidase domain-containing protein [Streptomyces hoynatensis]|uniref:Penicillin-binding protein n=1 Tax=Streptomyces hoynatensis TaxID=1141874 RepID=A0A3A9YP01_9ACTN|nr:penicillin-binding transpeptidase domain-containing protein [Streptomyces hoynatensis]RKN37760.1 penicillin-binding protein [Streptomyces hoynatensis]